MIALHCGHAPYRRELEPAGLAVAPAVGTAGSVEWRLGATARLLYDVESAAHAAAARGQRILTTRNSSESQSGWDGRDFRCGVDETFAEGRRLAARSVCVANARKWMGNAGGDAWL